MGDYSSFSTTIGKEEAVLKINAAFAASDVGHLHTGVSGQGGKLAYTAISGQIPTSKVSGMFATTVLSGNLNGSNVSGAVAIATTGPASAMGFYYSLGEGPYSISSLTRNQADSDTDAWYSVGPTGSGADIIYSPLNSLPAGVKGIRVNLDAYVDHGTSATGTVNIYVRIRKHGSVSNTMNPCVIARTDLNGEYDYGYNTIDVQLDSNKMFDIYWVKTMITGSTGAVKLYLEGYYI